MEKLLSLIGTADGGVTPPLMAVQEAILEENASKPIGILAYATELGFNVILLCGVYRNDLALLRIYTYFVIAAIFTTTLIYSIVNAAISLLTKLIIIFNLIFQGYVILLVRSAIVEIRENKSFKKDQIVVTYSVASEVEEAKVNIEAPAVSTQTEPVNEVDVNSDRDTPEPASADSVDEKPAENPRET
ncbi:unnamed protein product [Leptidea sinapis]|uniref:Uncharacterized protein n=1 Tax=Leptidea sinapis TaxID=189913 RepID=A0A5E4Q8V2_9NEOP|nr:unnamed protein product [Leptidea sinapis]